MSVATLKSVTVRRRGLLSHLRIRHSKALCFEFADGYVLQFAMPLPGTDAEEAGRMLFRAQEEVRLYAQGKWRRYVDD